MKSEKKRTILVLAGGSLMLLGCIIPDKSATAPTVAPGSAASIGGGGVSAGSGGCCAGRGGGEGLRPERADRRRRGREQPEPAERQPRRLLVHVQGQGATTS